MGPLRHTKLGTAGRCLLQSLGKQLMISLCGVEGWSAFGCGALCPPSVCLQTSHFAASQCSVRRRLLPSSSHLLFAAGCVFWTIVLVARGKTSRSEDSPCQQAFFQKCCRCDGIRNVNTSSLQTWCFVYNPGSIHTAPAAWIIFAPALIVESRK